MGRESGLDAIISAFIRNPELSSVKYDVKKDIIKVEAALSNSISEETRTRFLNRCCQSLQILYRTTKLKPDYIQLSFVENAGITILRLFRDSHTLSEEEVELFVQLLRQSFAALLIKDNNDIAAGAVLTGEIKKNLLNKIRQSNESYQNIFAYRDQGRVFVFNK